jgi:endonuclease YncB( thermonuclease family)
MGNCCAPPRRVSHQSLQAPKSLSGDTLIQAPPELLVCNKYPSAELVARLCAAEKGEDFSYNGRAFLAKVVDCYDGDTLRVVFEPSPGAALVQHVARMEGYDSPEMRPPAKAANRVAEKIAAVAARNALLAKIEPTHGLINITCGKFDKYGRILIKASTLTGENINDWMIANGHGRPYDGGKKGDPADAGTLEVGILEVS